jgi:hypothetical protein
MPPRSSGRPGRVNASGPFAIRAASPRRRRGMVSGRCHSGLRGHGRRRSSRLFLRTREPVEIVLSDFRQRWLQGLKNDGLQVGVNWSATATGYDMSPIEVERCLAAS